MSQASASSARPQRPASAALSADSSRPPSAGPGGPIQAPTPPHRVASGDIGKTDTPDAGLLNQTGSAETAPMDSGLQPGQLPSSSTLREAASASALDPFAAMPMMQSEAMGPDTSSPPRAEIPAGILASPTQQRRTNPPSPAGTGHSKTSAARRASWLDPANPGRQSISRRSIDNTRSDVGSNTNSQDSRHNFSNRVGADKAREEAAKKPKVRQLRKSIEDGGKVSAKDAIKSGGARRMSSGKFNVLYDPDVQATLEHDLTGRAQEDITTFEVTHEALNLSPNESITERMLEYANQRDAFAKQVAKERGCSYAQAAAQFRGDHGLLGGNDATLEALHIEEKIGTAGERVVESLEENMRLMEENMFKVGTIPGHSAWPESVYTTAHLAEQCGLNIPPDEVARRRPATLPAQTPAQVQEDAAAKGLRAGPQLGERYRDADAAWAKLLAHGCVWELAELADLPTGTVRMLKRVQELGVEAAWATHRRAVAEKEGTVRETQTKLAAALMKERDREGRKRRRDLAEDAVQAAAVGAAEDKEQTQEEQHWAWRYRRRKEREVPYAQQQGRVADGLFRRLATQLDGIKDVSARGWGLLDGFSDALSQQHVEFKTLQKRARERITAIIPVYREKLRGLREDLQSVQDTAAEAKEVSDSIEVRLREMHDGSEALLSRNLDRQREILAELRELVAERDAEVHRRLEEIHKENKRKREFSQFMGVAEKHKKVILEAIDRTIAVQEWIDRVSNAVEVCWPEIEKENYRNTHTVRQSRIESQDHVLGVMHSANSCRSDQVGHKLQKVASLERTLQTCEQQANFCRSTYDPQAIEHEAEVARLWGSLSQEVVQIRALRQTILSSADPVRDEEQRLRRIPGAAQRKLPVYEFERDRNLAEEEERRWAALSRQWGPGGRHDYSHIVADDPSPAAAIAAASRRPASCVPKAGQQPPLRGERPATAAAGLDGWGAADGQQHVLQPGGRIVVSGGRGKGTARPPLHHSHAAAADDDDVDSDEEPCIVTVREGNLLRLPILEGIMF